MRSPRVMHVSELNGVFTLNSCNSIAGRLFKRLLSARVARIVRNLQAPLEGCEVTEDGLRMSMCSYHYKNTLPSIAQTTD